MGRPAAEPEGGEKAKRPRGGIATGGPAVASRTLGMLGMIWNAPFVTASCGSA